MREKKHPKEISWKQIKVHQYNTEFKEIDPLDWIEYIPHTHTIPTFTFDGDLDEREWTFSGSIPINVNGENIIITDQDNAIRITSSELNSPFIYFPQNFSINTTGFVSITSAET